MAGDGNDHFGLAGLVDGGALAGVEAPEAGLDLRADSSELTAIISNFGFHGEQYESLSVFEGALLDDGAWTDGLAALSAGCLIMVNTGRGSFTLGVSATNLFDYLPHLGKLACNDRKLQEHRCNSYEEAQALSEKLMSEGRQHVLRPKIAGIDLRRATFEIEWRVYVEVAGK